MPLSPEGKAYAFFYPAVQGAVSERASTSDVFAAVRAAVEQSGRPAPPGLFKAVNDLRSSAVAERNYAALLARRGPETPILGVQVPQAIFARDVDVQAVNPLLQVDYQVDVRDQEGDISTKWLTSFGISFTPGLTAGDLADAVSLDAEAAAASYGTELVSDPVLGAVLAY